MKSPFLGGPAWNRGLKFDSCHFRGQNLREPLIQSTNGLIKLPGFWGWYSFLGRGTLLKEMSSLRSLRRGWQPSKTPDRSTGRVTDSKAMHTCPCVCTCNSRRQMVCIPVCVFFFWTNICSWLLSSFQSLGEYLNWNGRKTQRLATFPPCFWVDNVWLHGQALKPKKKKKPKTGPLDLWHENLLTSTAKSHFPPWS